MRLKRLLLENVCQFRQLDHTFHAGLTGIVGPNGSGKSNFTKAIFFALTGTFRNVGVKADNVAQLGSGKKASATLWFEHEGVEMTLTRGLAGVVTELVIKDDPDAIRGDNAVTEKVMEILGVDVKLLGEYVFILQLHMTDFIEATAGDRAKVFQRLFGTDECESVNSFITKVIDKELAVVEQADLPAIRARLAQNTERMDGLVDKLERLDQEVVIYQAKELAAKKLVADADWLEMNEVARARLTRSLENIEAEADRYAKMQERDAAELAEFEAVLSDIAVDAQAARIKLATWKTAEARRSRAAVLAKRRQRLERDQENTPKPAEVAEPPRELDDEVTKLRIQDSQLTRKLKLATGGKAECPTCGQSVSHFPDINELTQTIRQIRERVDLIDKQLSDYDDYALASQQWLYWYDGHVQAMAELAADERALEQEQEVEPDVDPRILQETINAEQETREAITKLRKLYDSSSKEAAKYHGQREQVQSRVHEMAAEAKQRQVNPDALRAARADLERLASLCSQQSVTEGEVTELTRTLDSDEVLITRLVAVEQNNAAVKQLRHGAQQVADLTHRNAVPRLISEAHLDRLIDDVDEYLDMFGSDFRVRLGPGLSFVADFVDGRSQIGGRLSEGQKAVLALAFWVAVNSLFARQIGFLSLDEPTSSLDQQNLVAVEVALRQLRELTESLGLQCLLVTHEPSLAGLFDNVLQL